MGGRASQESIVPDEEVVFFARNAVILHICLCFNRLYGPPRLLELEVLWWGSRGGLVQGWRNRGPDPGHRSAREPSGKPSNHSIGKCHEPDYRGGCAGTLSRENGISSSVWRRLPAGSMSVGVINTSSFFFLVVLDSLRSNRPTNGKSASIGT